MMPLPIPNPDEEKDTFIDRCMGNDTMNEDFPDQSQRRAVCERQWDEDKAQATAKYPNIINAVFHQPWAILPEIYSIICELVRSRSLGIRLTAEQIQERLGAQERAPMVLQTLILSKERFATEAEATKWVRDHDHKVPEGGPDETEDSWRYRQRDPEDFEPNSFRTFDIEEGVKGVGGHLKNASAMAVSARHVAAGAARNGAIAVLPLYGVLAQRMNMMIHTSGGTSTELFGRAFKEAVHERSISAIVMDIDSPGGSVFGVEELASEIRAARGTKPIVAVANSMAASAAYWIASQADEIVVTPGGVVGAIGILTAHEDKSKAQEMAGIKTTIISAGRFKAEDAPFQPLSEEARTALQALVDQYYATFIQTVAKGRKVSIAAVKGGFGQGRLVNATDALAQGMVDTIGTLDQTIARLMGRGPQDQVGALGDIDLRQRRLRMASS